MLKKIFCIMLSLATIISFSGLSCVYGGINAATDTVDSKGYQWKLCTTELDFQNALNSSSKKAGLVGDNVGYGMVMFVAEYTAANGNKEYAYLSGSDNDVTVSVQDRNMIGQQLVNAYSLDGFEAGADIFYTEALPSVPWVKKVDDTGSDGKKPDSWQGSAYSIRNNGFNIPGQFYFTTLENIFATGNNANGSYYIGNGLSYKYKNIMSNYRSDGYLEALTKTDYFYIFFRGNANKGTEQEKIGNKKAVIKTFTDSKFVRDSSNEKNVDYDALTALKTDKFIGYSRSWSVTEKDGKPILFSSIYISNNDQLRIANMLIRIRQQCVGYSPAIGPIANMGDIQPEEVVSMYNDKLFDYGGKNPFWRVCDFKDAMVANSNLNYFKEYSGNVSTFGTDVDAGATMTDFYVYVGEKTDFTTTKFAERIENGEARRMSSKEQIGPGSTIIVEEGGTLIIDGTVFCYGEIYLKGGTLIVKGQLLNTYLSDPDFYSYTRDSDGFEKNNKATISADGGNIIVLEDGYINFEMCHSKIYLTNSSMCTYGMVCNNGKTVAINGSNFVVGNEGVYVQGGTLRTGENYNKYSHGGLNSMQSSSSASNILYSDFLYDAAPSNVGSYYNSFGYSNDSSYCIMGDLIMLNFIYKTKNLKYDLTQHYSTIVNSGI